MCSAKSHTSGHHEIVKLIGEGSDTSLLGDDLEHAWIKIESDISAVTQNFEENGARIGMPDDCNFEREGETIESGLRRTVESRDIVTRSLVRTVYRFRDATLIAEKKDYFGNALQKLYSEPERAETLIGPGGNLLVRLSSKTVRHWHHNPIPPQPACRS